MKHFVGGAAQAGYVTRIRGLPPDRCVVVAIDVGKHSAVALASDHHGEILADLFEFDLTTSGLARFLVVVSETQSRTGAESVRIGVEAAGHYHRALATSLAREELDVVELNPYQVKTARVQMGQARIKTDRRDCLAMVELLVRGQGWPLHGHDGPVAEQAVWVAHRRRKRATALALGSQIHALADLAFPGLTGCFSTGLESKTLRTSVMDLISAGGARSSPGGGAAGARAPVALLLRVCGADHGITNVVLKGESSGPRGSLSVFAETSTAMKSGRRLGDAGHRVTGVA